MDKHTASQLFIAAHKAIHSIDDSFTGPTGTKHKIYLTKENRSRATDLLIRIGTKPSIVTVVEQSHASNSQFAERARKGEDISWLIPKFGEAGRIEKGQLVQFPKIS